MIDIPRFVVLDQNESFLCYIDNSSSEGLFFDNESFHTYFNGTAFSLEMNVVASLGSKSLLSNLECGHKIHFTDNNRGYAATIMAVENSNSMNSNKITCWGGSLELNNSVVQAYQATKAMSFAEYLAIFDPEGSLTIRTNELSDKKLKLSWDGESTLLARIISLITNFDAEFRIVQELGDRYKVNRTYIDSYHEYDQTHNGIGQRRNDIRIRYGENATNIERTVDIRELATAIRPEGDDGLTIVGLTKTETDEAGSTEYFTFKESGWIYAPQARDRFPSNLMGKNTNDRYIGVPWSYSTKDKNILYGQGLAELKKLCQPKVTYNVEGYFEGLNLGDIVRIEDYGFEPMLLLEARVYEIEKSWTRPQNTKYTFANYRELDNQIDSSLLTEMQKLIEQNKQYVVNIVSSVDLQFKNNEGTTDLSPLIIETGKDLTDEFTYAWYKDNVFISDSKTITVTANDVNDKATYTVKAYKDDALRGQAQCTITNVDDGQKGDKGDKGDKGNDGAPGKDGVGLTNTNVQYALSTSGISAPSSGWNANVPTLVKGQYLWTKTTWTYTDNSNETGYSVAYIAKDGNDGSDGIAGKDGVGITSTSFLYAQSTSGTTTPSSGWSTSIPSVHAGFYLWTKTSWNYTDGTTESAYTVSLMGKTGATGATGAQGPKGDTGASGKDGVAGKDGVGISDTTIQYASSASGTTKPTSGWQSTIPSVSAGNYLWTRTTLTYSDASSEDIYSVSRIGKDGNKGDDGIAGKDGVGLSSTTINYAASISGTTKPTSGWSTTIPSVAAGSYLWTRTVWTYTDSTSETGYSVAMMGKTGADGVAGKDGVGIKSTEVTYATSTSGTTSPTSGYTSSVPSVAKGSYLWTKTVWTYTDNSTETGYSVAYTGTNGNNGTNGVAGKDGVGITSTTITYASSTSGTTAPTSGYTASVPSVAEGSFLWTKTVWTYTDNSNETGYSVAKQGAKGSTGATGAQGPKGDTGSTGAKGADGKGVKSTDTTYASSTSGTSAPTSGYFTSVPTVAAGSFLWTKTVMTYTDNSTSTFYSVGKMGEQGPTGPKGNTGATGPKGDSTGIIAASTAPTTDLYVGKLYLNTTNGITYRYTGSSWEIWSIKAEMMSVASLSAINTNIGTVTAGILKSSDNLFQMNLNNKSFSMTKSEGKDTYNVSFVDGRLSSNIISTYTPYNEYGSLEGAIFEMRRVQRSNGKLTDSTRLEPTGFTNYLEGDIYRQLSFTNQGLEIRPGSTNTGVALNTGIELIGDITYLDLGNKNSTGKDYAARLVVGTNNYCELLNSGGPILLTAQGNNPVNLQGSNANVRNVTNTGWAGISASAFTQQSDSKYKYNIKDMPNRLNALLNIDFKSYRLWGENGKYQEGILADQNKELPFVVRVESDGKNDYMIDTYSYVTFLAKSLQEAVKKIEELEGTVNEYRREQNNQLSVGTD
ncbi:MAG TPA: hypothetical protein DIW21_04935 [Enterococcus sp.]|nr:hypothetical protein [Enterococcus sp.]